MKNGEEILVLDHGYVRYIEHWGSEERIIEAARMSTNKGFQGWETDEKLLKYLYTHKHMTPFEMAGLVIEVKAPIFVFREWHRHRTQSHNEMSARYIPLPNENYTPLEEHVYARSALSAGAQNRQSAGGRACTTEETRTWLAHLEQFYADAQQLYEEGLGFGVPKELARLVTPVGRYSRMRASANLRNWLQFLTLRCDEHAQWEIRQYAEAVASVLRTLFPRTLKLWVDDVNR